MPSTKKPALAAARYAMRIRLAENFRAVFYAPFYAAHALGLYAREGLDVELVSSSLPGDSISALLAGTIDLTWAGPMRVMKARDQQPLSPLVCFCEVVARDPFFLVGRADQIGFQLTDLPQLRLATVSEVPTPWMCLQHDLREQGLDPGKLERLADRTMAENFSALREKRLDVVQVFEPFVSMALREGIGSVLYAASERGPTVYTSFIATRESIARNGAAFAAMVRAVGLVQDLLAVQGPDALAAATASYYPDVPLDILTDSLLRYGSSGIWAGSPEISRPGFSRLAESLVSGGFLSRLPRYEDCVHQAVPQ